MPDLYMDVDTALAEVPVNILPLIDDTDFKTIEDAVAYNAAGMALKWHFVTTAGAMTETAVTPTSGGVHDWTDQGASGLYALEIPDSGGTVDNDTEGFGWFTGVATGILPWRGPTVCFRAAALNNALIDGGDVLDTNVTQLGGSTQSLTDLKDFADAGYDPATNKVQGVVLTDTTTTNTDMRGTNSAATASALATAQADLDIITGADGTIIASGTQTFNMTGSITGNLSGSVGSVTADVTTDTASRTASKADVSNLDAAVSTRAPASEYDTEMARITANVATEAKQDIIDTNLDALIVTVGNLNDIAATDIVSAGAITTNTGAVVSVTTVATTTTNSDMRGTNSALLAASYTAPDNAGITQIQADIAALNDVAATDIVSAGAITTLLGAIVNVDLVDTTTTNSDMRGTDSALLAASAPTNFGDMAITVTTGKVTVGTNDDKAGYSISGTITTLDALDTAQDTQHGITQTAIGNLNDFNPASDDVAVVTLVTTTTTNSDMRGTDSAFLAASYTAPDNAGITQTQADIAALNDISAADILTTQLTESYAADGVAPTLSQAIFLVSQALTEFSITDTTITVLELDGITTAATYTIDDDTTPTSRTRAT